jgi:hypothetical protein
MISNSTHLVDLGVEPMTTPSNLTCKQYKIYTDISDMLYLRTEQCLNVIEQNIHNNVLHVILD